jgi:DNA-binding NtrC family response regulator
MNFSNPILICDENEDFRILIRDMLTKNGFFHVVEASNAQEALDYLSEKKDFLVLADARIMSANLTTSLLKQKNFVIFADNSESSTALLAAKVGVHHIMSYPVHSRKLVEKINRLI